jgi:hypothetical protein
MSDSEGINKREESPKCSGQNCFVWSMVEVGAELVLVPGRLTGRGAHSLAL